MGKRMTRTIRVALSVTGSAILLFSCADKDAGRASASEETMMTEYSEDLSVVMSQNGRRSYHSSRRCSKVIRWPANLTANSARA